MSYWMEKKRIAWLSVASNTVLTAGKLIAGFATGSVSILSEAAHSAIDLIAAGIATFSVHVSDRPPDRTHQYGHEKIENVSGVIEGLLIFGAAVWIIYEAVDKLVHGVDLKYLGHGLVVMGISGAVNLVVATLLKKSCDSKPFCCIGSGCSTSVRGRVHLHRGVRGSCRDYGRQADFFKADLAWLDPVIAIGVAVLILATAYRITRKSFFPLLDSSASPEEIRQDRRRDERIRQRTVWIFTSSAPGVPEDLCTWIFTWDLSRGCLLSRGMI